jgi:hypothetical protein
MSSTRTQIINPAPGGSAWTSHPEHLIQRGIAVMTEDGKLRIIEDPELNVTPVVHSFTARERLP